MVLVPRRRKGKKELVRAGLRIPDECQSACIRQLCVAKQIADDVCGKHSTFEVIAGQELDRAEPVIFVFPVRFNVVLSAHTFSLDESRFSRNRGRNSRCQRLAQAPIRRSSWLRRTTDYATVLLPLPGISNDLDVVRLL